MRVLRNSIWPTMTGTPVTTVVRDCDVKDTLESCVHRVLTPGALVTSDIFEADATDHFQVTMEALERFHSHFREDEEQMAIAYHWNAQTLRMMGSDGLLINDKPSPITVKDYPTVLVQLAQHPDYDHQTVVVVTVEHIILQMHDGDIVTLDELPVVPGGFD